MVEGDEMTDRTKFCLLASAIAAAIIPVANVALLANSYVPRYGVLNGIGSIVLESSFEMIQVYFAFALAYTILNFARPQEIHNHEKQFAILLAGSFHLARIGLFLLGVAGIGAGLIYLGTLILVPIVAGIFRTLVLPLLD